MFTVAILGGGIISSVHQEAWKLLEDSGEAKVVAVSDLISDKLNKMAEPFDNPRKYSDADALLAAEKPDIVDICLPTALHVEYSMKGMRSGANVLCEKPLALSSEQASALLDVQKETGKRMMVAHCVRFNPVYEYLARCIQEKPFGRLLSLQLNRVSGRRGPEESWRDWPSHEELSGSSVFDLNIHDLDYMRSLFGNPDTLFAELYYHHNNPEHMFSLYRYGDIVINIETGWDMPRGGVFPWTCGYRAVFETACLEYNTRFGGKLTWYIEEGIKRECTAADHLDGTPSGISASFPSSYALEVRYFADCLKKGIPFTRCRLEDSIESVRLTEETVKFAKARIPK